MVKLGELAVGRLDLSLVRVVGDAEDLVIVLRLGTFERDLGFLDEGVDDVRFGRVFLLGFLKGSDGGVEFLCRDLDL